MTFTKKIAELSQRYNDDYTAGQIQAYEDAQATLEKIKEKVLSVVAELVGDETEDDAQRYCMFKQEIDRVFAEDVE